MRRTFRALASLALIAHATSTAAQTQIMCVGDSITGGSDNHPSYRYPLWFDLQAAEYDVQFVGPFNEPNGGGCNGDVPSECLYPLYDNPSFQGGRHHAAICGATSQIIEDNISTWIQTYQPHIVMIHVGGRDVGCSGASGVDSADVNLRSIIDLIRATQTNTVILLSQITPLAAFSSGGTGCSYGTNSVLIPAFNARISTIVNDKNMIPGYPHVILVDQHTGFDIPSMMQADGVHPNTAGEQQMADVWREKLSTVLGPTQTCHVEKPVPVPNSLLALYTFDAGTIEVGTASDVSVGNNRTCVGFGGPQFVATGWEGGGVSLDGASYMWADVALSPTPQPKLTMGAWVYPFSISSGQALICQENGGYDRCMGIGSCQTQTGFINGWVAHKGGTNNCNGYLGYFPASHMQWQFVAAIYDSVSNTVTLYKDGATIGPVAGSPGVGDAYFQIGHNPAFANNYDTTFSGILDNVFVIAEALSVERLNEINVFGYHRIPTCPVVVQQPVCRTACVGALTYFFIDAAGSELILPLMYQWRKNGEEIPGAITPTLPIGNVSIEDAGSYDCVITNGCGSSQSHAVLLTVVGSILGDGNGDGTANGRDIGGIVYVLSAGIPVSGPALCAYDLNADGMVTTADISPFVSLLIGL